MFVSSINVTFTYSKPFIPTLTYVTNNFYNTQSVTQCNCCYWYYYYYP